MATMNTTDVKHVREDLVDAINDISPESTPFMSLIGSTKASNTFHEYLRDELSDPNPNNAAIEGADAPEAVQVGPIREGNWTQIFTETVSISGTLQAVKTAGTNDELGRQIAKKGKEMKRSIEAAFVSANASVATGARKLGGAEACIKTNADHGIGGSTAGYNNGTIGAVVAGTVRDFEEDMFLDMSSRVWQHHDTDLTVFVNAPLKRAISQFNGNATKFQKAETSKIYANVDYYQTDFGLIKVLPHRSVSPTTVLAFDPSLWAAAYVRKFDKKALGRTGDADKFQLLTEVTLECRNEKGNGKIADVQAAA